MSDFQVAFIMAFMGLIFGSFASAVSFRIVHNQSLLTCSRCQTCGTPLGTAALIPLISYILQRGYCRYCNQRISIRYPLIELLTAFIFFIIGISISDPVNRVLLCLLALSLVILIVTDFEYYIIPDVIQFMMAVIGIFYAYYNYYPLVHVLFMPLLCYLIGLILQKGSKVVMKKDGLGSGDVKFFGVAGIFLKVEMLAGFFFVSGLIGILIALVWRLSGKGEEFPFGPALASSLYLCLVFPQVSNITNFMM